jgi:hypothetical protein
MKTNYIVETDTETLTFPINHEGLEAAIKAASNNHTNVDVQSQAPDGSFSSEEVWNFAEVWRDVVAP